MENLKGKSMDLTEDNLNKLKELFPEVFEEGKIDFDKLRLILGDEVDDNEERYEFTWHGKNNAIRIAQTPSTGTLRPDKESSKNWDDTENLYIEGDNLEVLKLLQKSYFGKVKMIYIDPPYNTGNDFVYHDNFRDSIPNYKKITNQTTKANPETNGRYHTDWLNLMYPRLKLARNLLKEDGVIFISIDDNEVDNLRKICDEIFGELNLIVCITREAIKGGSISKNIKITHDYILCYAKSYEKVDFRGIEIEGIKLNLQDEKGRYAKGRELNKWGAGSRREDSPSMYYPVPGPGGVEIYPIRNDGSHGRWRLGKEKLFKLINNGDVIYEKRDNGTYIIYEKIRDNSPREKQFISLFKDEYVNSKGTEEIKKLFNIEKSIFEYAKPTRLINDLLLMSTDNDDIILDFFSGSSTTAHAVMQLNTEDIGKRNFIMVQLPEQTDEKSEAYKSGYKNICEIGKERIRRAGDKIVSENKDKEGIENLDIGFKVFKLDSSNLKSWDSSIDNLEQNLLDMESNLKKDRTNEDLLYEILLKSGVELTAKIEEIKVGYNTLYNIGQGALLACLDDKITQDVIDEIPKHRSAFMDTKVIFKEAGFMSDAAKINAVQNLKQFKIEDVRSV